MTEARSSRADERTFFWTLSTKKKVDFSVPEYLIKRMERETTVGGIIVEDFTQWLGPEDILTKIDPFQLSRGDSRTFSTFMKQSPDQTRGLRGRANGPSWNYED